MYEGWVCFGGTEVINNMRAIGYAGTASQLTNRWTPPIPPKAPTFMATNLFTNPSFEAGSGTVEVSKNLMIDPLFTNLAAWSFYNSTVVLDGAGGVDMTLTALTNGNLVHPVQNTALAALPLESPYSVGYTVENLGAAPVTLRAAVWDNAAYKYGAPVTIAPGEEAVVGISEQIVSGSYTSPRLHGVSAPAATHIRVSEPRLTPASVLGEFFAPGLVTDPDLTASWTGAANASESVLTGVPVAGVTASACVAIRSEKFGGSMRLIATGTLTDSYASVIIPAQAHVLGTWMGTSHLETPLAGTLHARAFRAVVFTPEQPTPPATPVPNEPGSYPQRAIFSSLTQHYSARLYHGGSEGSGDVYWTHAGLFEGEYEYDWFDGNSIPRAGEQFYWNGEANASTSDWILSGQSQEWPNYCDITWFDNDDDCPHLWDALTEWYYPGDDESDNYPYEAQYIQQDAPWASTSVYEAANKFLGAYALSITSLSDATRTVPIVEGILDGGILGRSRKAVPTFRFRVLLTAVDMEGLEYGTSWLIRALGEQNCSFHGPSCGSTDLTFFAACPPDPASFITPEGVSDPNWEYNLLLRSYHDVKCVEGPIVSQEFNREPNSWGRIVEFTLAAGVPNLYGATGLQEGSIDGSAASVFTDIPRNAIPTPSAELPTGGLIVSTNYSTNPSVETNATGWAVTNDSVNITPAMCVGARVTGELAAVGTSSYRVVFTATGAGSNGWFGAQQQVEIAGRPAGSRISINMWSAEILTAGTPVRTDITVTAIWRNGTTEISSQVVGNLPVDGGAVTATGLLPPAGTTNVIVRAQANLTSWPAGTIVRLYSDALAVTVP